MRWLLIIRHDASFVPTPALVEQIHAWDREMNVRGIRLVGVPLRPPVDGFTVRVRNARSEVTIGAFAAQGEQVAAFELLECAGPGEARDIAATHPMAAAGAIEVRPVWAELERPD
jgi:hypothetical protein